MPGELFLKYVDLHKIDRWKLALNFIDLSKIKKIGKREELIRT